MKFRRLGNSGLRVSALGLGTNAFGRRADEATSIRILHQAIDSGVTFIDTANIYAGTESERIIGKALKGRRQDVILTTKAGLPTGSGPYDLGSSRQHLMREIEKSIKRLDTDYLDLYQIHTFDPHTPLEETLRTLDDLVQSGKVRYIGASNYQAWEMVKALGISDRFGWTRYVSNQISYSLADRTPEQEMTAMCRDQGIGLIAYFPLAGGILTGKYGSTDEVPAGSRAATDPRFKDRLDPHRLALAQTVVDLASSLQVPPAAVALAWLLTRPEVSSAIAGATKPEQLEDNLKALDVELTEDMLKTLDQASQPFIYAPPFASYRLPDV